MKFQRHIKNIFTTLFLLNLVHAQDNIEKEKNENLILIPGPITGKYNKVDLDETYDESSIEIQCAGTTCNSSSDNVLLDEGKITISNPGTYILGGELNGQLNITATKEDIIHLVLRNITISSDFGPAIYGEKCKNVIITTEGQNTISDSNNYPEGAATDEGDDEAKNDEAENNEAENKESENKTSKPPNACIFIKSNLTFNGKGSLDVNSNFNEGIRSKKNLKLVSGKINVTSKGNGIKAKQSVSIKDAEINIDSGKTGIKVTKDTEPEEGFIVIDGGKINVKSIKDGIHAETHLTINDGIIKVTDCEEGLEGQMIDIVGGDIYVDATNDGINASKIGAIKESESVRNDNNSKDANEVEPIDDDITVDAEEDSEYETEKSEENNISAKVIEESTEAVPQDDYNIDEQVYLRIVGGKIDVRVEGRNLDGIDSNGSLYIGGDAEVYVGVVFGGAFGHFSSVDSDGYKSINGNSTALITGSGKFYSDNVSEDGIKGESGTGSITVEDLKMMYPEKPMEEIESIINFTREYAESGKEFIYDEPNTCSYFQPYVRVVFDVQKAGIPIIITDSEGKVLIERIPRAQFGIIFFTSPELVVGEAYTITAGKKTETVIAKIDDN